MKKEKIVKIALAKLLRGDMEKFNISTFSETIGLSDSQLNNLFPSGHNEIIMDAVEYAGKLWIHEIKEKIKRTDDIEKKIEILTVGYALGSEEYPDSLSVYIDLWKIVKDNKEQYIKERLKAVYLMYIQEFIGIVESICPVLVSKEELNAYSIFMTVLSDAIHIQSIILGNDVNYEAIGKVIRKISLAYFLPNRLEDVEYSVSNKIYN